MTDREARGIALRLELMARDAADGTPLGAEVSSYLAVAAGEVRRLAGEGPEGPRRRQGERIEMPRANEG